MLFNSISFLIFLPIVYTIYWIAQNKKIKKELEIQNSILLIASYVFYSFWNVQFCFLLIFSTLLDFYSGQKIAASKTEHQKRFWFWVSVIINLGLLAFLKYVNFFIDNTLSISQFLGINLPIHTLQIILPIGISFYTFHGLSYVIDIYKGKTQPEKSFINYSLFVSFFPLLVAGPIERSNHLLPQIGKKRTFDRNQSVLGLQQMLWGFVKKIIIADNFAPYVNIIFENHEHLNSITLLLGVFLFAFQIYGDFSGYTDIAIGTAKLFGIELLTNFTYPYFSKNMSEFWKRWHISLSSWFRDYVYFPLGGNRNGIYKTIRNTFIIFIISGFWHGAAWSFIFWGALNAIFSLPFQLNKRSLLPENNLGNSLAIFFTFICTCFCWIFFRATNLKHAFSFIQHMFSDFSNFHILLSGRQRLTEVFIVFIVFIFWEWKGKSLATPLQTINKNNKWVKWSVYYIIIGLIAYFYKGNEEFIYFQF